MQVLHKHTRRQNTRVYKTNIFKIFNEKRNTTGLERWLSIEEHLLPSPEDWNVDAVDRWISRAYWLLAEVRKYEPQVPASKE